MANVTLEEVYDLTSACFIFVLLALIFLLFLAIFTDRRLQKLERVGKMYSIRFADNDELLLSNKDFSALYDDFCVLLDVWRIDKSRGFVLMYDGWEKPVPLCFGVGDNSF